MVAKLKYPKALIQRAITMARAKGVSETARAMKLPRSTVDKWLNQGVGMAERASKKQVIADLVEMMRVRGPVIGVNDFTKDAPSGATWKSYFRHWPDLLSAARRSAGISDEDVTRAERDHRRETDRVVDLQRRLKLAERELNAAEDFRQSVFNLSTQPIDAPQWSVALPPKSDSVPGIPVLFASDFQWGEVIKANELDGINAFNARIASERYKRLIERAIDLCHSHMVNPKYPGIIYLRGGDMVSGDIHQELRETNDLSSIPACIDLIEHECTGIRQLADKFGKVWVISVPGNHGRTTIKPHAKKYVETNYDYLIACMIEREFRNDSRVQFMTPMSGDARFKVYDWHFVLTHGDRIGSSGGQGFIGPAATITRGMKKLVDYYAGLRQHVDWCLVGHFHTAMELEYGFSNGSLPGYSEYAKTFRARPQSPTQWLFFVHPKNGVTARWKILLDTKSRMAMTNDPVALAA
jgi:hypothetical protein